MVIGSRLCRLIVQRNHGSRFYVAQNLTTRDDRETLRGWYCAVHLGPWLLTLTGWGR